MVMKRNANGQALTDKLINEIIEEMLIESKPDDGQYKEPAIRKQWVVVVYDPEGELKGKEFTGSVVQIPEDESVYTAVERLHRAGYEFNTTKKGRRMPVKTIGEVCEHVPARIAKEQGVWIKHKEPCFLLATDGLLPTDCPKIQSRRVAQTPLFAGEPIDAKFEKELDGAFDKLEAGMKAARTPALVEANNFLALFKKDPAAARAQADKLSPEAHTVLTACLDLSRVVNGFAKSEPAKKYGATVEVVAGKEGK